MTNQTDDPYDDTNQTPTDSQLNQKGYLNKRPAGGTLALHQGEEGEDLLDQEDIPPD